MNLVFDLGGVIVTWDAEALLRESFPDEDERRRARDCTFDHPDWIELHRGKLDREVAIERFASRAGTSTDTMRAFMDCVRAAPQVIAGAVDMLRALERDGHQLYCLSNMHEAVYVNLLERASFWNVFVGVVASCAVGTMKPELEIYRYLLRMYALDPDETVFVDDTQANVDAAIACGMKAFRFTSIEDCRERIAVLGRQ